MSLPWRSNRAVSTTTGKPKWTRLVVEESELLLIWFDSCHYRYYSDTLHGWMACSVTGPGVLVSPVLVTTGLTRCPNTSWKKSWIFCSSSILFWMSDRFESSCFIHFHPVRSSLLTVVHLPTMVMTAKDFESKERRPPNDVWVTNREVFVAPSSTQKHIPFFSPLHRRRVSFFWRRRFLFIEKYVIYGKVDLTFNFGRMFLYKGIIEFVTETMLVVVSSVYLSKNLIIVVRLRCTKLGGVWLRPLRTQDGVSFFLFLQMLNVCQTTQRNSMLTTWTS